MKKQYYIGILVSILLLSLGLALVDTSAQPVRAETASLSTTRLPESTDFATVTFGDAWDMSQFTDVSQYLNGAGRNPSLTSILVQDGVFSATSTVSTTDPDAFIFPLFPGYPNVMQLGNWGSISPIIPSQYHCLYIAMKVNSTSTNDSYRVLWYPDQNLVVPSTTSNSGSIYPLNLYPEWGTSRYWKLQMVDLSAPPSGYIGKPWTSYSPWLGLELIMTHYDNISLAIDWIRLTPCHTDPQYRTTVTWTPSASVTALWVRPQGTTRDIRVTKGLNGLSGSYSLDTQGLAPGVYSVGLGDDTTCCSQWSTDQLEINTSPILDFDRPSTTSGVDYSTTAGDAWDMNAASDIDAIQCASWSFANNLLLLDTEYPALIDEPGCLGPEVGEADPKVYLNLPGLLESGKDYRYLSFRLYQNGTISIPADGMIVRWIWTDLTNCIRVSQMVALEVGWNEYNIDLYHPFNGLPVAYAYCSVNPLQPWREVGGIKTLRFDPNENWTGKILPAMIFHQEIDWIRLTKVDGVWQGSIFPIEVTLNKAPSTVQYIDFYYTSNRSQPQQYYIGRTTPGLAAAEVAEAETLPGINVPLVNQFHYLPFLVRNISAYPPLLPNQVRYLWNTSSVVPGEYYICGRAYDGLNLTTFCSKAPLQIRTP
jgi:hypothetical protein